MGPFNPAFAGWFRVLLLAALVFIGWQSLTPNPVPLPAAGGDKLAHLFGFLGLALLADLAWPDRPIGWRALALLATYGAGIEIAQAYVPNRTTSVADLVADLGGLALYTGLLGPSLRRLFSRSS